MALSRELLKRLSSEDYPLPKRLKLAETAFSTLDLPFIQKEELLLEWLCKTCVTNLCAWETLNNYLKFPHINLKVNIKQCLVNMLAQKLKNHTEYIDDRVLMCCRLIFANNSMRQYFTNKPEILCFLVKALFNHMLKQSNYYNVIQEEYNQLPKPCKLSSARNQAIISIIESLMQIYKQSIIKKKELRTMFIHDVLYPMCNIIDHRYIDNTNKLNIVAYKCIQNILLGKNKSIRSKQSMENSHAIFSDLFFVLSENVKTLNLQSNLVTYVFVLRAVIGLYKLDAALLDLFFRNVINSSGRYKWEILNASLKLLDNIALDSENIIEGVTLSEYFQQIISDILTHENITYVHYRILAQLSYINPFLIEKNISDIFNKILMKDQTPDYTNLLIAILYSSTKLRREQKFISYLLISLKHHIATTKTHTVEMFTFFPHDFKMKLTISMSNVPKQAIESLRTLMYYLNTDCMEMLQCDNSCKNVLMLTTTVELIVIIFEGMQIFEYDRALSIQEKFVNTLDELRNTLSLLINQALCLSYNKNVITILLTAIYSLCEMQTLIKSYMPNVASTKKLLFPISDESWRQLIQRISNFGEDSCKNIMNRLILHQIKQNISNKSVKLHGLIGGLKYSWITILKHNRDVLSLLNDKEISKITDLLLADMVTNGKCPVEWFDILDTECIQENKCFVVCLLSRIFLQIGQCFLSGCTKSIIEYINVKLLMENEYSGGDKLIEVLQIIKEKISQQQWVQMTNKVSCKIKLYLEILFHVPIIYLSSDIKMLTFLVIYSINKECEKNDKISTLCNVIFSDLLEKSEIDIFQYIEPAVLVNLLPQNKAFFKICQLFLRKVTLYNTLKNLIKSAQSKETMCIVLECMEAVKPKLSTDQKIIFKKAEKKLTKNILNLLPEKISNADDIRCLLRVLKVTILTKKITDSLKKLTKLTLQDIFVVKENFNVSTNSLLLKGGIQLAIFVLRYRKIFEIQDTIIKNLWLVILEQSHEDLLEPLLASAELKEFYEILKLLYDKTITSLLQTDELTWTSMFIIWNNMTKTEMRVKRNKIRFLAINNLFETMQLLHLPDRYWSDLLCLLHDIITTKHLVIPNNTIDLIIMISIKSLKRFNILSCKKVLAICISLIKTRMNLIRDSLPSLLLLYRSIVKAILDASKNINVKFHEPQFRCFAFDIEKFINLLIKLKKDIIRLSPYLIADLLQLLSESAIPSCLKMALQNSLCSLISICDQHGIALLSRSLPISSQEIFKVQLETFKKFHKYSGKV